MLPLWQGLDKASLSLDPHRLMKVDVRVAALDTRGCDDQDPHNYNVKRGVRTDEVRLVNREGSGHKRSHEDAPQHAIYGQGDA